MDEIIKRNDNDFKSKINEKFNSLKEKRNKILGEEQVNDIEKRIFLQVIDQNWKNHIQYLEQLRQVIGLRSYGNRDPLIEYKKEAFNLFENLLIKLKTDLILILMNLNIVENVENLRKERQKIKENKINPDLVKKKIGRNDPCFCGSKKKYKHCCGSL